MMIVDGDEYAAHIVADYFVPALATLEGEEWPADSKTTQALAQLWLENKGLDTAQFVRSSPFGEAKCEITGDAAMCETVLFKVGGPISVEERLTAQVAMLKEAVEFYANASIYVEKIDTNQIKWRCTVMDETGTVARDALAKLEAMTDE